MNIQKIEITKLKPAEYNPRKDLKPEDEEYQKIKRSIIEFGYVAPVIVNSDMTVIGGHQRLKVLKELGYNEVECVVVDLNKNKEKVLNIALNKISGDWDNSKLEELLAELKETDINLDITGFSFDEVDNILKDITGSKEDDFDIQQALDEIDEPTTKTGDIWILGKHRLMCGDSTIIDNVYKVTNKEKVKVLFTDPPYNMAFNGRSGNFDVIKNDNLDNKEFEIFIDKFLNIVTKVIMPEAYYICCNWCFYGILQLRLNPKACIVWAKNNFGLGKGYRHQHEFILFDGYIKENIKNETDLWNIDRDVKYEHPTQKPVDLVARAIQNSSKENDLILDLFGGSGSTLIAAEQTKRKCYTMELDPKYCDVIVKRWETLTGEKAELQK